MKKSIYILLLIGLLGYITANAQKNEKQRILNLDTFEKVVITGHADIYLSSASQNEMKVSCDKEVDWNLFKNEIKNGTLYIDYDHPNEKNNYSVEPKFTIQLAYQHIESLWLEGKIWVQTEDELKSRNLKIDGDGIVKGHMQVHAENLTVEMEGITRLRLDGKAENVKMTLEGIGGIDASRLIARRALTKIEGIGKIQVKAQEELIGSVSGIGSLKYSGDPERRSIDKEGIFVVRAQ